MHFRVVVICGPSLNLSLMVIVYADVGVMVQIASAPQVFMASINVKRWRLQFVQLYEYLPAVGSVDPFSFRTPLRLRRFVARVPDKIMSMTRFDLDSAMVAAHCISRDGHRNLNRDLDWREAIECVL